MDEQSAKSPEPQPETTEPVTDYPVMYQQSAESPDSKPETTEDQGLPLYNHAEHIWHKNRLQEYTQRSGITFPYYRTINEGSQHAPAFRSTVFVGGTYYTTPITFSKRKAAEQEAARVAWDGVEQKIKDEGYSRICKVAGHLSHKNRLQEYTQRSGLPFPDYRTINEGSQHAPAFRSTVFVGGTYYSTPITFSNRKAAEQEAARVAWDGAKQKIKDEGYSLICKDTTFCKSILNEYAVKLKQENPTYATIQSGDLVPVFLSSSVHNGVSYTGEAGRNKEEAEQLAARAVILSILGNSDSETVIFEIIKSKFRLYAALYQHKDTNHTQNGFMPLAVNTGTSAGFPPRTGNVPTTAILETCPDQLSIIPAVQQTFHEFKKPRLVPSYEIITPPMVFVPPVLEQPLGVGQSSVRKQNHKNKKVPSCYGALNETPHSSSVEK